MSSWFGWLDHCEQDRRRMLDVIDLFRQKDSVDEMGLGSVRDTLANLLSPGTSTIQTRARYFFFIPWMYKDLERRKYDGDRMAGEARNFEVKLSAALTASGDPQGTFGREAGAAIKRLPSSVYWAGLKRLGFRYFDGAQQRYHRFAHRRAEIANWNPYLPDQPAELPGVASHHLTRAEGQFFENQLQQHAQGSLFHFIVDSRDPGADALGPWDHPLFGSMPAELRYWLTEARNYAELMHGAALLYNLLLSRKRGMEEFATNYTARMQEWSLVIQARAADLRSWNRGALWDLIRRNNPRMPPQTRSFSECWINMVLSREDPAALRDDAAARQLIAGRERALKGARARLFSQPHLESWGGESGASMLDYRWFITRNLAREIIAGLEAN
ncbi:MAG: DUF6361 family protein [Pseudomonadota bacterium]|nr:DUF6361 family protein [Pseudomonadota bacterium]